FASPPSLGGDETHVGDLFAGTGIELAFERETIRMSGSSPEDFVDFMATYYGPLVTARGALEGPGKWDGLREQLVEITSGLHAEDGERSGPDAEYLVVSGIKSG
ncbi:MAG: hypothetical protein ACR2N5_03000, partial [Solirubrobacterales bacterium]